MQNTFLLTQTLISESFLYKRCTQHSQQSELQSAQTQILPSQALGGLAVDYREKMGKSAQMS